MLPHECLALGAGEDAGSGANRADTTGAQGTGDAQAVLHTQAVQHSVDETRVEGIAAAAAIDVVDGIGPRAQSAAGVYQDGAFTTHRDDHHAGPELAEYLR